MRDVMKYSTEAFAERMLLEGDLQGNRIVLQLLQQRAELLGALQESTDMLIRIMESKDWGAIEEQIMDNQATIAKTEASE